MSDRRRRMPTPLPRDRHFDPGTSRNAAVSLPALGRDVPFRMGAGGVPMPDLEYRVVDYGAMGIRHETRCPHCGRWLSYMNRDEAATIYLRCEDHKPWENGPYSG